MMLDNAREHGVDVHEGVRVLDVLFEGDRAVGVTIKDEDGAIREVRAKVVVDASGQNGLIMNRLRLRVWDPMLNKGAIWTYWEGAYRDTGRDEGATLVHPDRRTRRAGSGTSRCTTTSSASASWRRSTTCSRDAASYAADLRRGSRALPGREGARRRTPSASTGYFATKDYSYRSKQVAGDGWVLVGDAFGFLDPLYSSGVLLALKSGELAADAIVEGLAKGDTSAAQLGKWGAGFNEGVDRMRRLVCEYYDGFSFGNMVRQYPDLRGTLTDLLIGDLFNDRVDKVWGPLESLYQPGKAPIPTWNAGTRADRRTTSPTSSCCLTVARVRV